ncbi:MAG: helix-turn-helix transcriptional regulator [Acidobacteria bacterium]|nr:helix-turn-helix transcriptional regulator [Acidobacteriota bacterium]
MQTTGIRDRLGERVRYLRNSLGWSQEKLGEEAGMHPTYVGGIERGERNVSLENLAKLAEAFHITLSELLNFPDEPPSSGKDELRSRIRRLLKRRDVAAKKFLTDLDEDLLNLRRKLHELERLVEDDETRDG